MGLQESLQQILAQDQPLLGERFYAKFLERAPTARQFFQNTNLQHQVHLLVNSLQMVVALTGDNHPAARSYLKVIGHRHYERQIPEELYAPFRDAMLDALKEIQSKAWTTDLESEWRVALDGAIAVMLEGYTAEPVFY